MSDPTTIVGAGILFLTQDNQALFLQRSSEGDHAGEWCLPGGKVEGSETLLEAARREATEEIGPHPRGEVAVLTRTRRLEDASEVVVSAPGTTTPAPGAGATSPPLVPAPGATNVVDFTTFVQRVDRPFEVLLDAEHVAFTWAPISSPPLPLHPGVVTSIRRLSMNELDVAEAIRDGFLTSGQRFHGMTLVDMRVTGTGTAYRRGRKEYVVRHPELYLNERFLQRCNGLAVILEHPEKNNLNSEEFHDRAVGNIFLPYIKGDEVWGIAKIYDDTTAKMLESGQLSTSPSVVFRNPSETNTKLKMEDGTVLLIEGEPSLLDHLAICKRGVWDKGGEPRGIAFETIGDADMTDEEKKAAEEKARKDAEEKEREEAAKKDAEERAKKDAENGEKLDKVLKCLDSVTSRMDAYDEREKARQDAAEEDARKRGDEEQARKDKAKKDADEAREKSEREEQEKKDAEERERKDAETAAALAALDQRLKPLSDEDLNAMADAQMRSDSVFSLHGLSGTRPLPGEALLSYRRRVAGKLKAFSPRWKDIDLGVISDSAAFSNIEDQIYADAEASGRNPVDIPVDTLRQQVTRDITGRQIISFQGRPGAWMRSHSRMRLLGIKNGS